LLKSLKYLFTILSVSFWAQNPVFNFQKLDSEDGLNNANIFNVEQHSNGLIYVTTQNGIYVYDGYSFEKLKIEGIQPNALLNSSLQNNNEFIFSLRDEGLVKYDLISKKISFLNTKKISNNADNMLLMGNYAYLLTTGIKLQTLNLKTGELIADHISQTNKLNRAFCFYKNGDELLVGRNDGLYNILNGKQTLLPVLKNRLVSSITKNTEGQLFIGSSDKIFVLDENYKILSEIIPKYKSKATTFLLGGEKSIDKIVCDKFNKIWFTSYPDENLFLQQNGVTYNVFEILGIPPKLINCLFKDANDNIWVGTYNDGLYFIQNSFFNAFNFSYSGKPLTVNQIYLKNSLLFAATANGLYGLNLNSYQTKTLSKPDEIIQEPINAITESNKIIYYCKKSQFDKSPSILSDNNSVYKFKPIIAKLYYPINSNQSVVADWFSNILLCNADASKTIDTLISFPDYRISVNAVVKKENSLFVATNTGLYVYDFLKRTYQQLSGAEINFYINDLAIINSRLYAAHESGITDVSNKKLIQQCRNVTLNSVKKIKYNSGAIWLGTLNGVYVCDTMFNILKIINKSTGLPSNSINDINFSENVVAIGTARGVAVASLQDVSSYISILNPVTLGTIKVENREINAIDNKLTLLSEDNDLSIAFNSPIFIKPSKQYFRYRENNGTFSYLVSPLLPLAITGGKHLIEISASADNINWSKPLQLNIFKEEKLSETQWIYWIFTVGGLALISFMSMMVVKRVKLKAIKRLHEEQQVHLLKHQAMNALLSPHFIFNSLTSIQNYINTNNSLKASEYLAKFSRLIRMIIEKATQREITLHDELTRLTYYLELEKERFKNKFDYIINIGEKINTHEIKIPNMIIQPHVENCIIHGILPKHEHGTLSVSFNFVSEKILKISIEDDGIGLIKAKSHAKTGHKSLGTNTIRTILEINSKISGKKQNVSMIDKSEIDTTKHGTLITIELEQ
jgi:ligand-binding sensor domain-containing protein